MINSNKVSEYKLEKYIVGELSEDDKKSIQIDPILIKRIKRLQNQANEIRNKYPYDLIKQRIDTVTIKKQKKQLFLSYQFGIACFSVLLIGNLFWSAFINHENKYNNLNSDFNKSIRMKGINPVLHIYKKTDQGFSELKTNDTVYQGDVLQISYNSGSRKYGGVFSLDGNGLLTLHYPARADQSPVLKKQGEVLLDYGYELDNAPEFERFFFITSQNPFSLKIIIDKMYQFIQKAKNLKTDQININYDFDIKNIVLLKGNKQ